MCFEFVWFFLSSRTLAVNSVSDFFSVNKAGDFVSTETKFASSNSVSGGTLKHARSITGSSLPIARVTKPEAIPARSQTLTAKGVEDGRKGEKGRVTKNALWMVSLAPIAHCHVKPRSADEKNNNCMLRYANQLLSASYVNK